MKAFLNRTTFALTAAALIAASSASLAHAEAFWVPIENWSYSEVVYDVRISASYDDDWGYNHLGYELLPDYSTGLDVVIWDTCSVDIKVETDWTIHEVYDVNICDMAAIIVSDGEAWVEYYDDYGHGYGH